MNPILVLPSSTEAAPLPLSLQAALSYLCTLGKWDYGEIWLPTETDNVLELYPVVHITAHQNLATAIALEQFWICTKGLIFPPNGGLPGRVWSSQQPEWLADATAPSEREFLRHYIAKALSVKTGFGLPILVEQQVVAVVVFFMTSIREPDPESIALMTAAAAQVGTQLAKIL